MATCRVTMEPRSIRVLADAESLDQEAAALFVRRAGSAVKERGRFSVALAGGDTPRGMYRRLAGPPASPG